MDRIVLSVREKKDLIKKLGAKCVYCGCNHLFLLNLDHKTPLCRGGEDIEKNKQVTCIFCNNFKADMTHIEFKGYLKILNKLSDMNKIKMVGSLPIIELKPTCLINPPISPGLKKNNDRINSRMEKK